MARTTARAVRPLLSEEVSPSEAIIRVLEQAGINMIFGMPGGNTGAIFNALYDHQETVRTVLVREEARAGVMAEVYGRLTGKPGVAMGQGAFMANVTLGAIEAHLSSSPMLLLADLSDHAPYSQHGPYQSGAGEYGTWDAKQMFSAITKLTLVATSGSHAVQCTQLAIKHALSGERGPVAVLYHSQSLRGRVGPDSRPPLYATDSYLPGAPPMGRFRQLRDAAGECGDRRRGCSSGGWLEACGDRLRQRESEAPEPPTSDADSSGYRDEKRVVEFSCRDRADWRRQGGTYSISKCVDGG